MSDWLSRRCFQCGKALKEETAILINEEKGWFFCSEPCLHKHFEVQIETLSKELENRRKSDDIPLEEIGEYSEAVENILEEPAEIWLDQETFPELPIHHFIGEFSPEESGEESFYYVASVYMPTDVPSFVFVHFPTKDSQLVENFRRGRLIFDRSQAEIEVDSAHEDALSEGDELAQGLYQAMLKLRSSTDISESEFPRFIERRTETIEDSDEMWRHTDLQGNTIVTFIREFSEGEEEMTYVVVTVEDVVSGSHFILFSFPTRDSGLLERFRQGQNLQEDAMTRGESH